MRSDFTRSTKAQHASSLENVHLWLPTLSTYATSLSQIRAFVRRPGDASKQELNQSPLTFIESPFLSDAQQALARKDAIIRVRNAQVWQGALSGDTCPGPATGVG